MDYDDEPAVAFDLERQGARVAEKPRDMVARAIEDEQRLKAQIKDAGPLIEGRARARMAVVSVATRAAVPLAAAAGIVAASVGSLFLPGQLAGFVWAFAVVGLPAVAVKRARSFGRRMRNGARRKALASLVAERGGSLARQNPFAIPALTADDPKALHLDGDVAPAQRAGGSSSSAFPVR